MIHHVSVGTNDIKRARAFYEALMSHIGFRLLKASDKAVHFGSSDIMFSLETPINGLPATPGNGVHIAFQAPDRQTVRRFYEAAPPLKLEPVSDDRGRNRRIRCPDPDDRRRLHFRLAVPETRQRDKPGSRLRTNNASCFPSGS